MSREFDDFINRGKMELKNSLVFIAKVLRNPWKRIEEPHQLSWSTIILCFLLLQLVGSLFSGGILFLSFLAMGPGFALYGLILGGTWAALLQFGPKADFKDIAEVGVIAAIVTQTVSVLTGLLLGLLMMPRGIVWVSLLIGILFCVLFYHGLRSRIGS